MKLVTFVIIAAFLTGCGGGGGGSSTAPLPSTPGGTANAGTKAPVSTTIYFTSLIFHNSIPATIWGFSGGGSGSESPTQTIQDPSAPFTFIAPIATDSNGNIYTAYLAPEPPTGLGTEIAEYAAGGASSTPIRIIRGDATQLNQVTSIVVAPDGTLFVFQSRGLPACVGTAQLLVFSATASGNAAPQRQLSGANTGLDEVGGALSVDGSDNAYLGAFHSNTGPARIIVFGPTASGNVSPTRTISGPSTGMGMIRDLDATAGVVSVLSFDFPIITQYKILNFALTANGNASPTNTITLPLPAPGDGYDAIARDAAGRYYAGGYDGTGSNPAFVSVFAADASGSATPLNTLNPTVTVPPSGPITLNGKFAVH